MLSGCVFSCHRDNKRMAQNDTLPKDIEACHVLIDQLNEINQTLASELQSAKHEIE